MKKHYFLLPLLCLFVIASNAQDSPTVKHKWNFVAEPYLMFPNMNGTIGLGTLPDAPLDLNPGDILNHLQMGAMVYLEAHNDKWAVSSDFLYMKLGQDVTPNKIINKGDVTMKETVWEATGMYRVIPWLEVGAGLRLYSINTVLNLNYKTGLVFDTARTESLTKTWVDPIVITRITAPFKGKCLLQLRADIGGFGIGSKFAWQIQVDAGYKFSKLFQATVGYRYIDVDYESGSGSDRFLYNIATFGPTIRFAFNF